MNSPNFPRISTVPLEVLLISDAVAWIAHFDNMAKRTRKCGGIRCALCAMGSPRLELKVAMGVDANETRHLIEFRKRHAFVLDQMYNQRGQVHGHTIKVVKTGKALNSPIDVSILGFERVNEHSIVQLVASLGLPALLLGNPSESERQHDHTSALDRDSQSRQRRDDAYHV